MIQYIDYTLLNIYIVCFFKQVNMTKKEKEEIKELIKEAEQLQQQSKEARAELKKLFFL